MGKTDPNTNVPTNSSLSYTLNDLLSYVEIESNQNSHDLWEPLDIPGYSGPQIQLSQKGKDRFLAHFDFLKKQLGHEGTFVIRSTNNFPSDSGLASSASSFAALTKCASDALSDLAHKENLSNQEMANFSRQGSGSSCRSFFSPWAIWDKDGVRSIDLPYEDLIHHVVIVDYNIKSVSSSEAHLRVATSPSFATRPQRAEENLKTLLHALEEGDWRAAYEIVWKEFWDMHQLFQTANEPFSYMTDKSKAVLDALQSFWEKNGDGPLVTMDAGPNIHLLFRKDQADMAERIKRGFLVDYDVI